MCMRDPLRDKLFYVFYEDGEGYLCEIDCRNFWKVDKLGVIWESMQVVPQYAIFKNPKNNNYYAFVTGFGENKTTQYVFNVKNQKWYSLGNNSIDLKSEFGVNFTMISDLFDENTIHIAGGTYDSTKYGVLTFKKTNS